jgi:hypothetical protein
MILLGEKISGEKWLERNSAAIANEMTRATLRDQFAQ